MVWDAGIREHAAAEAVIDPVQPGTRIALVGYALDLLPLQFSL